MFDNVALRPKLTISNPNVGGLEDDEDFEVPSHDYKDEEDFSNSVDDKDIVVLSESNFYSPDGLFDKSAIKEFVFANPLVTTFSRESATLIFESPIKKQVLLFATSIGSSNVFQTFVDAAKLLKGKIIFVYVELDNEDVGKSVGDYFGITGDAPQVIGYTENDDGKKFVFDQDLTLENLKAFGEGFLEDKLKAFL